jgi:hypothetical protein
LIEITLSNAVEMDVFLATEYLVIPSSLAQCQKVHLCDVHSSISTNPKKNIVLVTSGDGKKQQIMLSFRIDYCMHLREIVNIAFYCYLYNIFLLRILSAYEKETIYLFLAALHFVFCCTFQWKIAKLCATEVDRWLGEKSKKRPNNTCYSQRVNKRDKK